MERRNLMPGRGLDEVYVGMPEQELNWRLGRAERLITFEQEKKDFQNFGYDISKMLMFFREFDQIHVYTGKKGYEHGIWKVYCGNERVVALKISKFLYSPDVMKAFRLYGAVPCFHTRFSEVAQHLDSKQLKRPSSKTDTEYLYLDEGIGFVSNTADDDIITINIFDPFTALEQEAFLGRDGLLA